MLCLVWSRWTNTLYRSTVQFYVDEPFVAPEGLSSIYQTQSNKVRRLYHESRSSHMLGHLIKKFDLQQHYRLEPDAPFRKAKAEERLLRRIEVKFSDTNSLSITVKDHDRNMAMLLANEIHRELVRLSESKAQKDIKLTRKVYQKALKDMDGRVKARDHRLRTYLDSLFWNGPQEGIAQGVGPEMLAMLARGGVTPDHALVGLVDQMAAVLDQKGQLMNVVLIRRAMPDLRTDPVRDAFLKVFGGTILLTVLFMWVILSIDRYGRELKEDLRELFAVPSVVPLPPAPAPLRPAASSGEKRKEQVVVPVTGLP